MLSPVCNVLFNKKNNSYRLVQQDVRYREKNIDETMERVVRVSGRQDREAVGCSAVLWSVFS